ncbi:hypothetical protein BDZ89DRAFT_1056778 [Hymenopellis radicata]|nr:hypothetical protein BDZ89DRAFT_1056778 [Hymenopellis radicata]
MTECYISRRVSLRSESSDASNTRLLIPLASRKDRETGLKKETGLVFCSLQILLLELTSELHQITRLLHFYHALLNLSRCQHGRTLSSYWLAALITSG